MEKQKIIEGNNLIAEFLKLEKEEFIGYDVSVFMHSKSCKVLTEDLCFHRDWCWLMPVVEKIEDTTCHEYYHYTVTIWNNCCKISDGNNANIISENFHPESKLLATWCAVIEFIKWYNQQKNTKVICNMCQGLSACSCEDTNPALP